MKKEITESTEIVLSKPETIDIYQIDALPAEYLARNQVEPERTAKIVTQAHERRQARNARRLKHAESSGQRRPVFKMKIKEAAQ